MEIKKKYLEKYLHLVAIDQLAEEYESLGYDVFKEEPVGTFKADIVAKKGNEVIVIEIKAGEMTPQKKAAMLEIDKYIRSRENYKFLVVLAKLPKEKKIEFSDVELLLLEYLNQDFPEELDQLSSHTIINDIFEIEIEEMKLRGNGEAYIKGNGVVELLLQFGSLKDEEKNSIDFPTEKFPFKFELLLKLNDDDTYYISDIMNLEINTSKYYT